MQHGLTTMNSRNAKRLAVLTILRDEIIEMGHYLG